MGFFAQAGEVLNGRQSASQPEDNVDGNKAPKLQPGESRAIDTKPHRLTDDHICVRRLFTGKATIKKINDRQHGAGEGYQNKRKECPTRPDVWKCLCNEKIQTTPTNNHQQEG